jgi:hypothetical protein
MATLRRTEAKAFFGAQIASVRPRRHALFCWNISDLVLFVVKDSDFSSCIQQLVCQQEVEEDLFGDVPLSDPVMDVSYCKECVHLKYQTYVSTYAVMTGNITKSSMAILVWLCGDSQRTHIPPLDEYVCNAWQHLSSPPRYANLLPLL